MVTALLETFKRHYKDDILFMCTCSSMVRACAEGCGKRVLNKINKVLKSLLFNVHKENAPGLCFSSLNPTHGDRADSMARLYSFRLLCTQPTVSTVQLFAICIHSSTFFFVRLYIILERCLSWHFT